MTAPRPGTPRRRTAFLARRCVGPRGEAQSIGGWGEGELTAESWSWEVRTLPGALHRAHPRFAVSSGVPRWGSVDSPMLTIVRVPDDQRMWRVTTDGDLPDDYEQSDYDASIGAWNDYAVRILELEINGYTRVGEEATRYGRRWVCSLSRGVEQMNVIIERTGMAQGVSVAS